MAIELQLDTREVAGSSLTSSGKGYVRGVITDPAFIRMYLLVQDLTNASELNWKLVDFSNPSVPVVSNWLIESTDQPSIFTSFYNGSDDLQTNCFTYDASDSSVVAVYVEANSPIQQRKHLRVLKISTTTGAVTYLDKILTAPNGEPSQQTTFTDEVRGVQLLSDGSLVVLTAAAVQDFNGVYTESLYLFKWNLTGTSYVSTPPPSPPSIDASAIQTTGLSSVPDGMLLGSDGTVLTFFGNGARCLKYNPTTLQYMGTSSILGSSNIGSTFNSAGGFYYATNKDFNSVSTLSIYKWLDRSTSVIDKQHSIFTLPDRLVVIGENSVVTMTMQLRDGFGQLISSLVGQMCRFTIVTNRGVVDSNDAALSSSSSGPFRDGNNTPITRSVDVPFNSSGIATAYFQSARTSTQQSVVDTVRVAYPAQ